MRVRKIIIKNPLSNNPPKGCVVCLPGLGVPAYVMLKFAKHMELKRTVMAALEPYRLAWYPRPNGIRDQARTVMGLPYAVAAARDSIEKIKKATDIKNNQIVLMGFSAGAVVGLQLAIQANEPFAACISFAGAIFEPHKVVKAKNQTPIFLQHNKLDDCFDWHERYLPTRDSLKANGYNLTIAERSEGHHTLYFEDAINASKFASPILGYSKKFVQKYLDSKIKKYN